MKPHALRFIFGGILSISVIVLHECAHYLVAAAHGFERHFRFAQIDIPPHQLSSPLSVFLVVAAGPSVDAAFSLGGFLWLRHLRSHRREVVATPMDWLATFFALCATRWLRCLVGTPGNPNPKDEAMISGLFALPNWLLPYALLPLAVALLVAAIRLHPEGRRMEPFAVAFLGIIVGRFLWMDHLGPYLLP